MDFNKLRNYNWENLKRTDLGNDYKSIFEEIYSILMHIQQPLLNFETTYPNLLPTDQQKLKVIYDDLSNFLAKATSFSTSPGETVAGGVERAQVLLNEIKNLYSVWIPKIAELQIYFRDELKRAVDNQTSNLQNQISTLSANLQNAVNGKISELDQKHTIQETENQTFLQNNQKVINGKISELDQSISNQQIQTQRFIETNQDVLNKKLSELDDKLKSANDSITQVENVKINVEKLNESVQNFSITNVVSEYGTIFEKQAKENKCDSKRFGIAFLLSILFTIGIVLRWFIPLVEEFNDPMNLKGVEYYILAFAIRFTVLFFACWIIKELLRNYNSSTHQYNLNTHRFNSLKSFEIIVRNNILPENRDDVVKQIAQTIFAHQEDGFLPNDKKDIPFNDIINLISALKK